MQTASGWSLRWKEQDMVLDFPPCPRNGPCCLGALPQPPLKRNQGEDWVRVSRTSQGRMKEMASTFVQAPLRGDAVCDEKESFAQPLSGAHG